MKPDIKICEKCFKNDCKCGVIVSFFSWQWVTINNQRVIMSRHVTEDCPYYLEQMLMKEK